MIRKYYNIFPALETKAYYDPFRQIINLSSVNQHDFASIQKDENISDIKIEILALYVHELTHWIDHIATLWGQQNLVLLFNALNARLSNNVEEFWRIKHYHDKCSVENSKSYYQTINNDLDKYEFKRWKHEISTISRFNHEGKGDLSKPILMVKFAYFNETPIARIPLTITSILESRATYNELKIQNYLLDEFEDVIEKEFRKRNAENDRLKILYNPDLILYNSIAHLTAIISNKIQLEEIFEIVYTISSIVLNFPQQEYSNLKKLNRNGEINKRYKKLIINQDLGFLYYNLLWNIGEKRLAKSISLEEVLRHSNLSSKSEFDMLVIEEMKNNINDLIDGPFYNHAKKLLKKGIEIFRVNGISSKIEDLLSTSNYKIKPKIIFGDTYFDDENFDLAKTVNKLIQNQDLTIEDEYHLLDKIEREFEKFINACI